MKIRNRSGELVELPSHITLEQRKAALEALGLPSHVGIYSTDIGVCTVTVKAHEIGEDGHNTGARLSVELPYGPPSSEG